MRDTAKTTASIEAPDGDAQALGQELINQTYAKADSLGRSIAKMLKSETEAERALGERLLDNLKHAVGLIGYDDDPAEAVRVAIRHDTARAAEALFRTALTHIVDKRSHEPKKRHAATQQVA